MEDKYINTKINNFKSDLVNLTTQSDLPISIVYYSIKDLLYDVEKAYKSTLAIEQTAMLAEIQEKQDVKEHQE